MKENNDINLTQLTIPAFGYELVRETLLKDILGKDYKSILYWGGKNLARKHPLETIQEIIDFFESAGLGTLKVTKENKNEMIFELTSDLITNRFARDSEYSYQLEAGFLAEQLQNIMGNEAETMEQQKKRLNTIIFTVQWE
ncbi:YslB family protein [Schinkia azotoformans]|nr:YslB family protein [Schinkia azotoformans]MEC1637784.1 YslB family protein [Schinkia azotoformans]MEC1720417.1 YslB family protein [Schinkia azotoformans]MEC1945019.1 YslB family protein [Schinkia azotoformans]MED4351678.1 YslB family protein [Schinkia azotoformans]MED4413953.1 YslB family protein [Schinkia azotoformans]